MRAIPSGFLPFAFILLVACLTPSSVIGQRSRTGLNVFGYLQGSFYYQNNAEDVPDANTFTAQQLNIFLRKNLARRWSAWINLEFTNNYSSFHNWGTFQLEEAWVKYRKDRYLTVKMGLLIPRFNYLNEVKNKTPLLPYIIRPLVYETSFREDVPIQDFVPQQAFVQLYGSVRSNEFEFDYAVYTGNSSNVNSDPGEGSTGIDTKTTVLVGGRVGIDYVGLKAGISATHDETDDLSGLSPDSLTQSVASRFGGTPRYRLGGDLSFEYKDLSFWSEFILVQYDDGIPDMNVDQSFWYATLGYLFWERLFVYGSYWWTEMNLAQLTEADGWQSTEFLVKILGPGLAYYLYERKISLKASVAIVDMEIDFPTAPTAKDFNHYALAISVMF